MGGSPTKSNQIAPKGQNTENKPGDKKVEDNKKVDGKVNKIEEEKKNSTNKS